jgi:hypothetical protein
MGQPAEAPAPAPAPAADAAAPAADAAAPAATTPAAPATPAVSGELKTLAADFLHYSMVNNVELVKANGQAILNANPDPKDLLAAFEGSAKDRGQDPLEYGRNVLNRNMRRDEIKDISKQLLEKLEEGYRVVSRDPTRIRQDIERLDDGARAYQNALEHLRAAGQFAAPIYLEYLQDTAKANLQPYIQKVIVEVGRPMVLPLVEQLQTSDAALRVKVITLLGQIGYRQSVPALRALQLDDKMDAETKRAAGAALGLIDKGGTAANASPTALHLEAAESYYERKSSYQPQLADEKMNPVWVFDAGLKNVSPMMVPTPIWNSVMAQRSARAAVQADSNNAKAISLWLAANLRKELQLPQGATDPTRNPATPDASFYALAAGPIYVNPVLARALDSKDTALALKAIDVLEQTQGKEGLVSGANSPLVRALSAADRSVRFRAAFALARANPENTFPSHFRVVPILAEAISSTGTPTALVVSPDDDKRNKMAEALRSGSTHYTVYAAATLSAALEQARRAPAFDVVVIANGAEVSRVAEVGGSDYRLSGVPVLVTAPEAALPGVKAQLGTTKGYVPVSEAADEAAINAALAAARADTGNVALDGDKASQFATTSLKLLSGLAADHKSIYNLNDAVPTLVEALKDKRPEIVSGSAGVLGQLKSNDAQKALGAAAVAPETDSGVRAAVYLALAESAKRNGNQLDSGTINSIIKALSAEQDAATRNAIATALGALNVPANPASRLILELAAPAAAPK